MMGDDNPDPTALFQSTFLSGPKCTGGLPSPIPDEFGPLNCGHQASPPFSAPIDLDRVTVASRIVHVIGLTNNFAFWRKAIRKSFMTHNLHGIDPPCNPGRQPTCEEGHRT